MGCLWGGSWCGAGPESPCPAARGHCSPELESQRAPAPPSHPQPPRLLVPRLPQAIELLGHEAADGTGSARVLMPWQDQGGREWTTAPQGTCRLPGFSPPIVCGQHPFMAGEAAPQLHWVWAPTGDPREGPAPHCLCTRGPQAWGPIRGVGGRRAPRGGIHVDGILLLWHLPWGLQLVDEGASGEHRAGGSGGTSAL